MKQVVSKIRTDTCVEALESWMDDEVKEQNLANAEAGLAELQTKVAATSERLDEAKQKHMIDQLNKREQSQAAALQQTVQYCELNAKSYLGQKFKNEVTADPDLQSKYKGLCQT